MKQKSFFLVLSLLFMSNTIFAQKNEFGLLLGGMNGLSYKHIVSDDFASCRPMSTYSSPAPS